MGTYTKRLYKKASHAGVCMCLAFFGFIATAGLCFSAWLSSDLWYVVFLILAVICGVQAIHYGRKAISLHKRASASELQDLRNLTPSQP